MKYLNFREIETNSEDDFVYLRLLNILRNVKLCQGGQALDATLRRHPRILNYCKAKQFSQLSAVESDYFHDNGSLNHSAIKESNIKRELALKNQGFTVS